jgi:hypothetical protein
MLSHGLKEEERKGSININIRDAPDIRPFLIPVSGRIPDCPAGHPTGYPGRPDTEYPAGYPANLKLIQ